MPRSRNPSLPLGCWLRNVNGGLVVGDNAYPVLALADGSIWAATLDGGLQHLRGTDPGEWQRPRLPFIAAWSLLASRDGSLWVGGDGICMPASGECSQHGLPAALQTQTPTRAMFEDAASRLWIGTIWGLWVREQGVFRMLDAAHGTLPGRSARAFIETAEQRLFVATDGDGILELAAGQRVRRIGTEEGL